MVTPHDRAGWATGLPGGASHDLEPGTGAIARPSHRAAGNSVQTLAAGRIMAANLAKLRQRDKSVRGAVMLVGLLRLPIELLRLAFYALVGVVDAIAGRKRRRFEATVLIKAPLDTVWRLYAADRIVFDGPPRMEIVAEPLPGEDGLTLSRISVAGREARVVVRRLERDATRGTSLIQIVPHELSHPPAEGIDHYAGANIKEGPGGTLLSMHHEVTFGSFGQRIKLPLGVRGIVGRMKQQCEKEAGTQSRLAELANHWLVLSIAALLSFWYLLGWQDALLIAVVIVLHELGHAAAMRMVGIPVQGIYLIPFFGGAAVPKAAYDSQGQLGFIALMGPGFSLAPTLALAGLYYATGEAWLLHAALMFALINGFNLLPIYPLDGGLILNALLGSVSGRLARAASWVGVLIGICATLYFQSLLIGVPVLVLGLCLYLSGGWTIELKPLSPTGGTALVMTFAATFAIYLSIFVKADSAKSIQAEIDALEPQLEWLEKLKKTAEVRTWSPLRCDLPVPSGEVLDQFLNERGELDSEEASLVFGPAETTLNASLVSWTRILAWADRAGHGDIARRWLASPPGVHRRRNLDFAGEMRIGHWLDLARSSLISDIQRELAVSRAADVNGYATLRDIFTTALIVYGRYKDAAALEPPISEPWHRPVWLPRTLQELVSAGATSEALWLLQHNRLDADILGPWGNGAHLLGLATMLQRNPSSYGVHQEVIAALTEQLRGLHKADRAEPLPACAANGWATCTPEEMKLYQSGVRLLGVRLSTIEALARFGQADFDLPEQLLKTDAWSRHVRAVAAAALEKEGNTGAAEAQRRLVVTLLPEHPPTPVSALFDITYAATGISISLGRGEVAQAERMAEAASERGVALGIRALMIDHYLWAGDWERAASWNKREILLGPGAGEGYPDTACRAISEALARELCYGYSDPIIRRNDSRPWYERPDKVGELRTRMQMNFQLKLAAAAATKGEASLATAALEQARQLACERATSAADMR